MRLENLFTHPAQSNVEKSIFTYGQLAVFMASDFTANLPKLGLVITGWVIVLVLVVYMYSSLDSSQIPRGSIARALVFVTIPQSLAFIPGYSPNEESALFLGFCMLVCFFLFSLGIVNIKYLRSRPPK